MKIRLFGAIVTLGVVLLPTLASAHQPRLVESATTTVTDPEISKAYYGELTGDPQVFTISADKPFALYVNVLVPDILGQKKDISAAIIKDGNLAVPFAVLEGNNFQWKQFFEPFGHDTYWMGPEFRGQVGPGEYEIRVWSSNNDSKYSLAVGETEAFDAKEGLNAIFLIPKIKRDFFNESPADFILSPFGWGYVVVLYALAALFGFVMRMLFKYFNLSAKSTKKSSQYACRAACLLVAMGLLAWAISTTWNPVLIFASGSALFGALFWY